MTICFGSTNKGLLCIINVLILSFPYLYNIYFTLTHVFYNALPYENDKIHGLEIFYNWLIAFKFKEASSSDYPPDKKKTPGTAGTTDLEKAKTVLKAIS